MLTTAGLIIAFVLYAVIRWNTEGTPDVVVHRVLPTSVAFPGSAPKLAWPATGQAAAEVEGVGSLGSMGGDTPRPIASVAKIMTAYLILQDHPLVKGASGFTLTMTAADVADEQARLEQGQSTVPVANGEQLSEYQALEALLLPSANNIAVKLADYDAGSVGAFVAKMNATAKRLGMTHTTYTDPSGLADTTVSTASDQLKLAAVAMRNPVFAQLVGLPQASLPVAGTVTNYDSLLGQDGFVGIKTGSDGEAEGCFVFAAHQRVGGRTVTVLGAVLGQGSGSMTSVIDSSLAASRTLVNSIDANLQRRTVVPAGTKVATVTSADGHRVPVVTARALTEVGWGGLRRPLTVSFEAPGNHVTRAQVLGTVEVGGPEPSSSHAVATATLPALSVGWRLSHLF